MSGSKGQPQGIDRSGQLRLSVCPELVEGRLKVRTQSWPFTPIILKCSDASFYTGHTDNLEQRFAQHQSGYFTGYTYKRRPVELVWSENFSTRYEALEAEKRIKGWTRAKKQALIEGDWELLSELARNCADRR